MKVKVTYTKDNETKVAYVCVCNEDYLYGGYDSVINDVKHKLHIQHIDFDDVIDITSW